MKRYKHVSFHDDNTTEFPSGGILFLSPLRNWRGWCNHLAASSRKESSPTEASARGWGSAGIAGLKFLRDVA